MEAELRVTQLIPTGVEPSVFAASWPEAGLKNISMVELAYLGDSLYELAARIYVLQLFSGHRMDQLHRHVVGLVNCGSQAAALKAVEALLTPQEAEIVRRGRNSGGKGPRNANPADYQQASGLEALIGYLYMTGERERLDYLLAFCLHRE